ncbi:MAG: cation-translocating P-type ATPase [Clostridia bacterium]|nr:cation-translocating P-type ATPase [Clostridia bacterium]
MISLCNKMNMKDIENNEVESKVDAIHECEHCKAAAEARNKQQEKKNCELCHEESQITESCCNLAPSIQSNEVNRALKPSECGCCHTPPPKMEAGKEKRQLVVKIVILALSLFSLVLGYFNWHEIGFMAFYYVNPSWVAVFLCGVPIFRAALNALSRKKVTAAALISIAILASITLEFLSLITNQHSDHSHSYIFAAGEVAFLMAIGGIIEAATVRKTRSGIARLIGLIPKEAYVKTSYGLEKRALENIAIGDIVVAKAGEMIAVDGIIVGGASSVDQSSVTGEYLPIDRAAGDAVYGGTFNQSGVLEIKVTKLLKDMTVAKMAELVEEAEGKKAPISRVADRWASYIVPLAIILSVIVGLLAVYAFRTSANIALIRAVTVLVVFCPCALALATPTAIAAGIGNAARNGVLIKSGQSLEALSHVDTICFDKTGTLTTGEIKLSDIAVADGVDKQEFVRLLAGVEAYSEHPIARAAVKYAGEVKLPVPTDTLTLQGIGIEAKIEDKNIKIYNYDYAIKRGYGNILLQTFAIDEMKEGKTVIAGIIDEKFVAAVSFSDTLRDNAKVIVSDITKKGYNTIMLTGDNEASAKFIGEQSGISNIRHSLLPADKQMIITELQTAGNKVCMLGDGINDAPSLKLSDCGIAMGALGNDMALDTADMAILNSDIAKVRDTLILSKRVLKTIKRNIVIAMSINFVAVTLSLFGILTPVTGAVVHNFTSILVVLSSALLLKNKRIQ